MVEVKKLPPGKALGADDLQHWAHQRMRGRSGVPKSKSERRLAKKRAEREDATAFWLRMAEARERGEK